MPRTVCFYIQRHGEYDDSGDLTIRGKQQVEAAARTHLCSIDFHYHCSSGIPRATQTLMTAAAAIGNPLPHTVMEDPFFGFEYLDNLADIEESYDIIDRSIRSMKKAGEQVTLRWLLDEFPPARIMRWALRSAMYHLSKMFAHMDSGQETWPFILLSGHINVLVGGHATASLAALNPSTMTGDLEHAGIIQYVWEVSENGIPELIESIYLPAPTID